MHKIKKNSIKKRSPSYSLSMCCVPGRTWAVGALAVGVAGCAYYTSQR